MNNLIIIPAYNVESKIKSVLDFLKCKKENVIVIDDGSADNTSQIVINENFRLIRHKKNMGLSQAINSGLEYAKVNGFERIVTIDADGQHDPEFIDEFISKLDLYDCVLGNRFFDISHVPSCKIASNLLASLIFFSITGKKITDVSCGYRGFKLASLTWQSIIDNFEVIYEQLYCILRQEIKYSIVNIPVIYPCDELHCTKINEIIGLLNVSIKYCGCQKSLMILRYMFDNIIEKKNFRVTIEGFEFYCFCIPHLNSYIFQTELNKAKSFYE